MQPDNYTLYMCTHVGQRNPTYSVFSLFFFLTPQSNKFATVLQFNIDNSNCIYVFSIQTVTAEFSAVCLATIVGNKV